MYFDGIKIASHKDAVLAKDQMASGDDEILSETLENQKSLSFLLDSNNAKIIQNYKNWTDSGETRQKKGGKFGDKTLNMQTQKLLDAFSPHAHKIRTVFSGFVTLS